MRELIRPTWFLVARLGLFFAVAAWIVGQWWWTSLVSPVFGVQTNLEIVQNGYSVTFSDDRTRISADFRRHRGGYHPPIAMPSALPVFCTGTWSDCRTWNVLNVAYVQAWSMGSTSSVWRVTCHHWLIVIIFALINGLLMWVYRKRGQELAADE